MSNHSVTPDLVERAALELVQKHSLDEIETLIRGLGVGDGDSEKLVLFIPSAFAAQYYSATGIAFPEHYLVGPPGNYVERSYSLEPIYGLARLLCGDWLLQGRQSLVLRVLDWSAEANGIKEAISNGLTPTRMSAVHHGLSN
jgi:hypothetical protein